MLVYVGAKTLCEYFSISGKLRDRTLAGYLEYSDICVDLHTDQLSQGIRLCPVTTLEKMEH